MAASWRYGWVIMWNEVIRAIPVDDKDTVKILKWLFILILRYPLNKIHTEMNK